MLRIIILLVFTTLSWTNIAFSAYGRCEAAAQSRSLRCTAYRQSTGYTCGPAAAMALLRYYGKITSKEMNNSTEMRIAAEMGATPKGTTPSQVESWLSSKGFSVSSGQCVTSSLIKRNIDRGIPTIVGYQQHWILAKGYNQHTIYFADSICGTTSLTDEDVDTMWSIDAMKKSYCGIHSGYYIIATP